MSNAVLVGLGVYVATAILPQVHGLIARSGYLVGGIAVNGVATALHIGAGLGPGARDGLMTALAARGQSIGRVRAAIEVSVLVVGWLLGGTVGIGTLLYAASIGPLVHYLVPRLAITTNGRSPMASAQVARHDTPAPSSTRLSVAHRRTS